MRSKLNYILAVGLLILGIISGVILGLFISNHIKNTADQKPLFYRNPMDPSITSKTPAKDHMGMDYIPVYAEDNLSKKIENTVTIDPVIVQNIGVRTTKAVKKTFGKSINTVGHIEFNEERIAKLHPKVDGWIEEVYINKTGQKIKKDEILLNFYSPILVTAQQEYLLALNNLKKLEKSNFLDIRKGAKDLVNSAKKRLELIDVPAHQIKELEETKEVKKNIHIHSPFAGTIVKIGAREGQYITPDTELYIIVDLSSVWVYADIYENEISWVNEGDKVEMTLQSIPGIIFKGKVNYIYPYSEENTRTTKIRILFDNKEELLRPNMFADIKIYSKQQKGSIVIPSEAIIRTGKNELVFVVISKGKYEPRLVKVGIESDGETAILSGISPGEEVVTSAQFLIDSESKLKEAASKMIEMIEMQKQKELQNNNIKNHGKHHHD